MRLILTEDVANLGSLGDTLWLKQVTEETT